MPFSPSPAIPPSTQASVGGSGGRAVGLWPARTWLLALNGAALLALALHFAAYIRYAVAAVRYPFELFEPEGIVWQQAMLIPGPRMYGDITQYPFLVFHYPPIYHLAVRVLAEMGLDPLAAGRGLSLLATFAIAALVAALSFRLAGTGAGRVSRLLGAAAGALVFFCFYPVMTMSPLMRSDTLAIALSLLGVWWATRGVYEGGQAPFRACPAWPLPAWPLYAAMVAFVLAAFTKQTCVIAPLAVLAVLFPTHPRRMAQVYGFGLLLGCAALAVLSAITHGGFLRHLVLYNINRFSLDLAVEQIRGQASQFLFVALAMVSLAVCWKQRPDAKTGPAGAGLAGAAVARTGLDGARPYGMPAGKNPTLAVLTVYLGLSTVTLIGLGKSGAGLNYFIEWMALLSVFIGVLCVTVARRLEAMTGADTGRTVTMAAGVLLPVLVLAQMRTLPASWDFGGADPVRTRQLEALVILIRTSAKPVLSEDMVLLMRAGQEVSWEPAIFTELASTGRWDEQRIIALIEGHRFGFVITRDEDEGRATPGVSGAIAAAYPRIARRAGRKLHWPAETGR